MKGLLHRLAARAAGTAVALRSDARLPYGADGLAWGDVPESPTMRVPQERPPADASRRPTPTGVESDWGDSALTRAAVSVAEPAPQLPPPFRSNVEGYEQDGQADAALREPPTLRPAVPEASPLSRGAPPHEAAPAAIESVAAPEGPEAGRSDVPPPQPRLPPAEPAAMPPEPPRRTAWPSEAPTWDEPPHPSPRAASADPAPLLPPAPHLAADTIGEPAARLPVPERRQIAWPLATPASAVDEATEVHIHIGRIDVTAVHEAPKVRAKPAKSTAVSLDAYLAARSKA
jgi:hypothetical protein